ncbi:MAG: sigma-54 dependent transcriptional regulator [Gammaproteobacteria bacterium]|nr:sigma-54 dependent transcriptional regulator [Gammaproteobacteria bacterium]MDH5801315.1 sigma-54 dependent transcriptional regulator [Gammaproteobacteria bacterium]
MEKATVLVVEDDQSLRDVIGSTLALAGYQTVMAQDGMDAMAIMEKHSVDLVVTDIQMPKMDGNTLLKSLRSRWPDLPVVMITAYASIQKAVESMKEGAVDYLAKPFEAEVLVNTVNQFISNAITDTNQIYICDDPKSLQVADMARRVAQTDATVLVNGESGSGKEVLARYIHENSSRKDKPFVAINCAAIPENMLEATLFGYEKGAFTGAYKACPGKFEQAEGGTLLLDEISEMDLGLQAKLLRVIQEREVERLGGSKMIDLDVRILATTNRKLAQEVKQGNFREDLFYRLSVFPITVPALRERAGDIEPITRALLEKHYRTFKNSNSQAGHGVLKQGNAGVPLQRPILSSGALQKLLAYHWPGNVRELDNVVQRALIYSGGSEITAEDIRFESFSTSLEEESVDVDSPCLEDEMQNHEHQKILKTLHEELGNRKVVAEKLGISQRTLRYKLARMREKGITIPERFGMVG